MVTVVDVIEMPAILVAAVVVLVSDNVLIKLPANEEPVAPEETKIPMPAIPPKAADAFVEADVILDIELAVTTGTPALPLTSIPLKAAVVALLFSDAFLIVLGKSAVPIIFVRPVESARIPLKAPDPEAMPKVVPTFERLAPVFRLPILKFGLIVLPMVFPETVILPEPAVFIPLIPPEINEVVPMASIAPMVLF